MISGDNDLDGSWEVMGVPGKGPKGIKAWLLIRDGEVVGHSIVLGTMGFQLGMGNPEMMKVLERERLMMIRPQ